MARESLDAGGEETFDDPLKAAEAYINLRPNDGWVLVRESQILPLPDMRYAEAAKGTGGIPRDVQQYVVALSSEKQCVLSCPTNFSGRYTCDDLQVHTADQLKIFKRVQKAVEASRGHLSEEMRLALYQSSGTHELLQDLHS